MKRSLLQKVLSVIVIIVVLYFMSKSFYRDWHKIPFQNLKFNVWYLVLSYLAMAANLLLEAYTWKISFKGFGEKVTFKRMNQLLAVARMAIYIPGRIWTILGTVYLAKRDGIPEDKTFANTILVTIINIISAFVIFLLCVGFALPTFLHNKVYLLFLFFLILLFSSYPPIFKKLVNFALKLAKRKPLNFNIRYQDFFILFSLYALNWALQGLNILLLLKSFYAISFNMLLPIIGFHSLSWIIGFLSFITPGGLGIREGIFSYALKYYLPTPISIIIVILARIWGMVGWLSFLLLFGYGLFKQIKKKENLKNLSVQKE